MVILINPITEHATQTEKKSIEKMLSSGMMHAYNKNDTKRYEIIQGTPIKSGNEGWEYIVRIWDKSAWFVGESPKWRTRNITIIYKKTINSPTT